MAEQLCGQQKLLVSRFHFLFSVCHYVGPFFTFCRFHGQQLVVDIYFNCQVFFKADPLTIQREMHYSDIAFYFIVCLSPYPVC